jgi:hypothetical protein
MQYFQNALAYFDTVVSFAHKMLIKFTPENTLAFFCSVNDEEKSITAVSRTRYRQVQKKSFFVILLAIPRYSSKLDDIKFEEL